MRAAADHRDDVGTVRALNWLASSGGLNERFSDRMKALMIGGIGRADSSRCSGSRPRWRMPHPRAHGGHLRDGSATARRLRRLPRDSGSRVRRRRRVGRRSRAIASGSAGASPGRSISAAAAAISARPVCASTAAIGQFSAFGSEAARLRITCRCPPATCTRFPTACRTGQPCSSSRSRRAAAFSSRWRSTQEARVAVLGDGRMGLLAAQVLKTATPNVVIFGRHEEKLAVARTPRAQRAARCPEVLWSSLRHRRRRDRPAWRVSLTRWTW